ncbi:hypothetical protein HWE04_02030 [Herbaspirillum sp. C7C2]|uniref:hypothetical protein n=1 Tax=Herbaspirillum sp. C7C2 TaxID=2736666 RepID=UPI001F524748|nr:hypothetical protein [Herbaspirillum sp. C7C2]MCI1012614.1 hypothetical protein [Herbaspirillum sp. C7C2]
MKTLVQVRCVPSKADFHEKKLHDHARVDCHAQHKFCFLEKFWASKTNRLAPIDTPATMAIGEHRGVLLVELQRTSFLFHLNVHIRKEIDMKNLLDKEKYQ